MQPLDAGRCRCHPADMRAITLHQPFASEIARGTKRIETRPWSTKHRGPIAIHAGVSTKALTGVAGLPLGVVVCTAMLVDVLPMVARFDGHESIVVHDDGSIEHVIPASDAHVPPLVHDVSDQQPLGIFEPGRFAWLLADVYPLDEPVPARGHLGLWTIDDALLVT
jgi:hypothetical protein